MNIKYNERLMKKLAGKLVEENADDGVAKCLVAYFDRELYPENYKNAIADLSSLELSEDNEKWLLEFLIKGSEYKYFDSIVDMLISKDLYSKYSQCLVDTKNRIEMENENFSSVPRDVFVCYSSNDSSIVEKIVEHLEADGSSCWYASRNMPRNSLQKIEYKQKIEDAISKCKVFLVVMSEDAMLSTDVQWELDIADKYGIENRLQYRIENVDNTTHFKRFFDGIQWIDASEETQYYVLLSRVYDMLHPKLDDEAMCNKIDSSKNKNVIDIDYDEDESLNIEEDQDESPYEVDDIDEPYSVEENSAESIPTLGNNDPPAFLKSYDDKELEEIALYHFEKGRHERAIAIIDQISLSSLESLTYYYIGQCFENGYGGLSKDSSNARHFYKLAEEALSNEDSENAGKSALMLAKKYSSGDFLEKNEETAFALFEKSAKCKNGKAMINLGICYKTAKGVQRDLYIAYKIFKSAVMYEPKEAYFQLGLCYSKGMGVEEDMEKANICFEISSRLGNDKAMVELGTSYYYQSKDYDNAIKWYRRSANFGNQFAQYNLGQCYFLGKGLPQSTEDAKYWLSMSAQSGNSKAIEFINNNF